MLEQKQIWQSEFGSAYTLRNIYSPDELDSFYLHEYGISRTAMNTDFLNNLSRDIKILEVGCNVGNQLRVLQNMGFYNLYGIELQANAVEEAKKLTTGINIIQGIADNIPFKDDFFDLVFTSGVLIHIPPDLHNIVCSEMVRCTNRFVWGFEYYADELVEVAYRGNSKLLWKCNYMDLFVDKFDMRALKVCDYKYSDNDNVDRMYLLEKRGKDDKIL